MRNADLLRTLSGCRFYQNYLQTHDGGGTPPSREPAPRSRPPRRWVDQVFRKYSLTVGWLLLGSLLLIVAPLWLVHPPYGKASLLGAPPMVVGALSWMVGVWWAWDKDQRVLMAVTMGAMPGRLFIGLAWVWVVLTIREVPLVPFVFSMMWYWIVFAVPEFAMLVELSQKRASQTMAPRPTARTPAASEPEPEDIRGHVHEPDPRVRPPHANPLGETSPESPPSPQPGRTRPEKER